MSYGSNILKIEQILRIEFQNKEVLLEAITHSSMANEKPNISHNERLEFLGDTVIDFIISKYLYQTFSDFSEGDMTFHRSQLVKGETLAEISKSLNLDDYILLGHGEEKSGGRSKKSNLAGLFEAIVGAVFVDQGLDKTENVVLGIFNSKLKGIDHFKYQHPKTELQIYSQANLGDLPEYQLISKKGPDHSPMFEVQLTLSDGKLIVGKGKSKSLAENDAAEKMLLSINHNSID
tara:strand:+ start:1195 stop:1896 length:702 start_codon:yes stop_codon:yes gene_type:complete